MRRYIWEEPDWPAFRVSLEAVLPAIERARFALGTLGGALAHAETSVREDALVEAAASSAVESSAIEGETLDYDAVRSSVARRLGIGVRGSRQDDRTEGVVAMTLDATTNAREPLTAERLFRWHRDLFPEGAGRNHDLTIGAWRLPERDPMQVVSGPRGRERVHFQAPPARELDEQMQAFLAWFNQPATENGLVRAALAHLWFVTIHPFEDGNGRLARAIADMALAQAEDSPDRFYSMSAQIRKERSAYYEILERTQRSRIDVTPWVVWFIECLCRAVEDAQRITAKTKLAAEFWQIYGTSDLNERQRRVLHRLLGDFEGDLNLRKYIAISGAPRATAQRDLADLVSKGIVHQTGSGRATRYLLRQRLA